MTQEFSAILLQRYRELQMRKEDLLNKISNEVALELESRRGQYEAVRKGAITEANEYLLKLIDSEFKKLKDLVPKTRWGEFQEVYSRMCKKYVFDK